MILFTRVEARDFGVLFAKSDSGRPRGPAPPIVIRFAEGQRIISCTTTDGVMLDHTSPATGEREELLVLPGSVLGEVEVSTDEGVKLDRQSKLRGVLHWHTGTKPHTLPVELILPGKHHELPVPPAFTSSSPGLLEALHECGRTAAKESGRFALSKIQIQGKTGRVVGTDARIALLFRDFKFPFADNLLVPAVPVFGSKLLDRGEVRIGLTKSHVVIAVGPWAVWLPTDTTARYPDVGSVIPGQSPTVAQINAEDSKELLRIIPGLPGKDEENRPVTIDAGGTLKVRGRDEIGGEKEVSLFRSQVMGPALQVAIDRRVLARMLSLGCFRLKLTPDKPVVAEGENITFVAAPLDPILIVSAAVDTRAVSIDSPTINSQPPISDERSTAMPVPEQNGHNHPRGDPPDPLPLAEEVRDALADATTKAARLVAALRHAKKEKKLLSSVLTNLKQLNLGTGGSP